LLEQVYLQDEYTSCCPAKTVNNVTDSALTPAMRIVLIPWYYSAALWKIVGNIAVTLKIHYTDKKNWEKICKGVTETELPSKSN